LLNKVSKHSSIPSVAEAVIVATVGALLLSIIMPVAETLAMQCKFRPLHQLYPQLLVPTVPVVAPAGTVTITFVVV
jgi:hypothetical protein